MGRMKPEDRFFPERTDLGRVTRGFATRNPSCGVSEKACLGERERDLVLVGGI